MANKTVSWTKNRWDTLGKAEASLIPWRCSLFASFSNKLDNKYGDNRSFYFKPSDGTILSYAISLTRI